jgi:GT2 family glycosyltransferase
MISVVIPHYKEKDKLYTNLKHNLPFLKECEVVVVNDYPEIPLKKEMASLFPEVTVIENEKNVGFAGAVSNGIAHTKNKYVFLLNNDVVLHDESFKQALSHFKKDNTLFAVSFRQIEKDKSSVGHNKIFWKNGFFQHTKTNANISGINGWAEGGSMLFDKEKYDAINGFDTLYSPFYWEDIDLSYRAWRAGYTILFDSSVTVQHHHTSTISTYFNSSHIKAISYRNQFITIWKNISDNKMIGEHLIYLLKNLITRLVKREKEFYMGFWMAAQLAQKIMEKRDIQKKMWKKTDREIFKQFEKL